VAALLLGRELVLEVHRGGACLDHRLRQLEAVESAAEPGLGVGDERHQPPRRMVPFGVVDLVGAEQSLVDAPHDVRDAVGRVEALVRIHLAGKVRVGRDLPAADVDRFEPGTNLLYGLVARGGPEGADVTVAREELSQPLGAEPGQRVLDRDAAAEALNVLLGIGPLDVPDGTPVRR
jgi:hypothetical protein